MHGFTATGYHGALMIRRAGLLFDVAPKYLRQHAGLEGGGNDVPHLIETLDEDIGCTRRLGA